MDNPDIQQYFNEIINTMNDGLFIVAPDGKFVMVNEAFENLTGYTAKEVIGKPCTILNCDGCEMAIKEQNAAWCTLFNRGKKVRKRCVVMKKDGSYLPVIKNASLLKDDEGNHVGAVETLTDMSAIDRFDLERDQLTLQRDQEGGFHGIIGKSSVMQKVFQVIEKAAQSDAPVMIYGESGTGKELVARATHELGRRKDGPFLQLNCAALNEALLESELFGHIKGAFTGAYKHRVGRFEAADGGDFFLDEIGDVPLSLQVKLLRVLETKKFERVGDHRPISVDVRIIAATNKHLDELIARSEFREDLYFRINVIPIHLPPLRNRMEDIPLLVNTMIQRLRTRTGKAITGLRRDAMDRFMSYSWPGNVRELKSALEYAFVIAEEGMIDLDQLPPQFPDKGENVSGESFPRSARDESERQALLAALRHTKGNQSRAADRLGVSRVTVWNRMRKYGIDVKKLVAHS